MNRELILKIRDAFASAWKDITRVYELIMKFFGSFEKAATPEDAQKEE